MDVRRALAGGLLWLAAIGPVVGGVDPAAVPLAAGLQKWLDGTTTLEGSFEQSLISGVLQGGLTERGRIWLERPGRLRWDYTEPDPKVAIFTGGKTLLYLAEDRQLIRGRLGADQVALPELLASDGRLADLFDAAAVPSAAGDPRGAVRLRLVPKLSSGSVEHVVLVLDKGGFPILGAEVLDAAGNRMAYTFSEWRRNRPIPAGLFAFEPPPGTEILDED